jgi:hypothetical protein
LTAVPTIFCWVEIKAMSIEFKKRAAKRGRPGKGCGREGVPKKKVGKREGKGPFGMDEFIDLFIGMEQSRVHQKLCLDFLSIQDGREEGLLMEELFPGKLGDGFWPTEGIPGSTIMWQLACVAEYKSFLRELEGRRRGTGLLYGYAYSASGENKREARLLYGYSPADYVPYHMGWESKTTTIPIEQAPAHVMRYYGKGVLCFRNAHLHTIERWSDSRIRPGLPAELDVEVLNAPYLTQDCGRSKGRGKCQCQREILCNAACYKSFPLVSPLLRLQRQAMTREAYANATRQSWYEDYLYCGSIDMEHLCWDGEAAKPKIRKLKEPAGASPCLQECLAADRYLMTMMPQEPDGSRDMERYLDLPVGTMNRATLVLQRIIVCPDTFRKLFCISEAHDLQLLRWRKLPSLTRQGLWFDEETVQKVHRCRPIISDVHKELSSVRDDLPGADKVTPAFNLVGTEGVRRVKEGRKEDPHALWLWERLREVEERGVVPAKHGPVRQRDVGRYLEMWEDEDEMAHKRFERFSEGMQRNDRQDAAFGALGYNRGEIHSPHQSCAERMADDFRWKGRTMWLPAEGYRFRGGYYKFRVDSYFLEAWMEGLTMVMDGTAPIAETGYSLEDDFFTFLLNLPGTLSCRPFSEVAVRRSYVMAPPCAPTLSEYECESEAWEDPDWVELRGGLHDEHMTWFWSRRFGYPPDQEEDDESGKCRPNFELFREHVGLFRGARGTREIFFGLFENEFGHEPSWNRNFWTKYWREEFSALGYLEELGFMEPRPDHLPPRGNDRSAFCDVSGVTGDTYDNFGTDTGEYTSFARFCHRVYVVGLEKAFEHEFGHGPTADMDRWSNNRSAERRAYWVVTGHSHSDAGCGHPPTVRKWAGGTGGWRYKPRPISTSVEWEKELQGPDWVLAKLRSHRFWESYDDCVGERMAAYQNAIYTANSTEFTPAAEKGVEMWTNDDSSDDQLSALIPRRIQMVARQKTVGGIPTHITVEFSSDCGSHGQDSLAREK